MMRLRRMLYQLPLPAYAVLAWLFGAVVMSVLFAAMHLPGNLAGGIDTSSVVIGALVSTFVAIISVFTERAKRREWPSTSERLDFDRVLDRPEAVPEGEPFSRRWLKELRAVADSKSMRFLQLVLLAPVTLLYIVAPTAETGVMAPRIVVVAILYALLAIGAVLGYRRARRAELVLGRAAGAGEE